MKFYENNSGFFGNIKNLSFSGSTSFAKREKKGNINLFKKDTYNSTNIVGTNGMMMGSTGGDSLTIIII